VGDVDISGSVAYAVGVLDSGGDQEGIILRATLGGGGFGTFAVLPFSVPRCSVGGGIDVVPVLNEVEIVPGGQFVWVAGQCGRVWRFTTPDGPLEEYQSQTDAHVRGMSFPSATSGVMACNRPDGSQSSIVGYNQ